MKQPKALTRDLKIAASAYGLVPSQWMLLKDEGGSYVTLISKDGKKQKTIDRYARKKR